MSVSRASLKKMKGSGCGMEYVYGNGDGVCQTDICVVEYIYVVNMGWPYLYLLYVLCKNNVN